MVDVENHTDYIQIKGFCIPCKLSRIYIVYTSTVFNSVVPYKVRYTSAPNSHNCKPSPEIIPSQQPKGRYSFTDYLD